jgi:hypothetical protein
LPLEKRRPHILIVAAIAMRAHGVVPPCSRCRSFAAALLFFSPSAVPAFRSGWRIPAKKPVRRVAKEDQK